MIFFIFSAYNLKTRSHDLADNASGKMLSKVNLSDRKNLTLKKFIPSVDYDCKFQILS